MQIVRTIVWVVLLTALLVFSFANWDPTVTVKIWSNLVVETKIPAIVVVSFLVGFVPMWLLYRANRWQSRRRLTTLETNARTVTPNPAVIERETIVTPAEHPAPAPVAPREPPPGL